MRKFPRIEIDQIAYDGLQIEAVLSHKSTKNIATQAILNHISKKALSVLDHKTIVPEDIATERPLDHKTTEGAAIESGKPKKKRLSANPDALNKMREMWNQSPRPSYAAIARAIGYPKPTVFDAIQRMKKEGEFPD